MIGFNDWDDDEMVHNCTTQCGVIKDNKKTMPTKALDRYHVTFFKEVLNGDSVDMFDSKAVAVYQCIVDVESAEEAERWAQEHLSAVAELTNCLSWDETNDLPVADVIGVKVVPLVEFVKHLVDATQVLIETENEL